MAGSVDPNEGPRNDLDHLYYALLHPQSSMSPKACAERIVAIASTFINEHPNDTSPESDPETPGAEDLSWTLWLHLLKALDNWDTQDQFKHNLSRAIAFVKALQSLPEQPKWWIWGQEVSISSSLLIETIMRGAYNGPFTYKSPAYDAIDRPEVQNALAGAPPATPAQDKNVNIAIACRKRWLIIQGFIVGLWIDIGISGFDVYSIWAIRQALEEWPLQPPSIFESEGDGEGLRRKEKPGCLALEVEAAAVWLRLAGPQIYALTEIWGAKGNPDWPPHDQSAPGRGGERWKGVDGMDKEKKRWVLWREVLHEVIAWYDREQAAGRGAGWKVKEAATAALEAMHNVDQK